MEVIKNIVAGIAILVAFAIQPVFSQAPSFEKPAVQLGSEYSVKKGSWVPNILDTKGEGYLALQWSNGELGLLRLNESMNVTEQTVLDLSQGSKKKRFEFVIRFQSKLLLLSSFINQKHQKKYLFAQTIDEEKLTAADDTKKLSEIFYPKSKRNSGSFSYDVSQDSTKLLLFANLPYSKGEAERFHFEVFDTDLNSIWQQDVKLPYLDRDFSIEQYVVDNDGNVYVLGQLNNNEYRLLKYGASTNDATDYGIKQDGKRLNEMRMSVRSDGTIVSGGFYSTGAVNSGVDGSFFFRIDGKTGRIVASSFEDFDNDFILKSATVAEAKSARKKVKKGKDLALPSYEFRDIILREDGGAMLVGEQIIIKVVTTTSADSQGRMTTRTTYYYFYNDLVVVNIAPDGDIDWVKNIPKEQTSVNDGGYNSSYSMLVHEDKLHFVFYNNLRQGKSLSGLVSVAIDLNGEETWDKIPETDATKLIFRGKGGQQVSNNVLIMPGEYKKQRQFVKFTFD